MEVDIKVITIYVFIFATDNYMTMHAWHGRLIILVYIIDFTAEVNFSLKRVVVLIVWYVFQNGLASRLSLVLLQTFLCNLHTYAVFPWSVSWIFHKLHIGF